MIKYSQLRPLNHTTKRYINENSRKIEILLSETNSILNGLGRIAANQIEKAYGKTMSFDEVFDLYNKGISKEEVQAWVWYKRSLGVPMTGWEKFFLTGDKQARTNMVVAKKAVVVKDNHFRDIRTVPAGTEIGKYIKKHQYSNTLTYFIVRAKDGLYYVSAKDVEITNSESSYGTEKELRMLIENGTLFYCGGELLPYPIFAYANMYDRYQQLQEDKDFIIDTWGQDIFEKHHKTIKDATPERLTVTSPDKTMRPIISAISNFATYTDIFHIKIVREEYLNINKAQQFKKVNGEIRKKSRKEKIDFDFDGETPYALRDVFIAWLYSLNVDIDFNKSDPTNIVDYYILNKPLRNDYLSKEEKAELKSNARAEGEDLFSRFLNEVLTFEDQQKLDWTWNRIYNAQSDINYARIPVAFSCSSFFKSGVLRLTHAQREGVAFQEAVGSGINAFDVGVGKTMTAIATLAQNITNGKAKRPLIVVPKPTYQKWINEIIGYTDDKTKQFVPGVLSGTGVKVNEWYNLGTNIVKKIDITKAVPEKSITIVTYEGFKKIGFGDGVADSVFDELCNVLGQSNVGIGARDKEIDYQKFREMIGVGLKNTILDIDEVGFDYLVIDEAHRAKNVFASVNKDDEDNKRYLLTGAQSELGVKTFFLTNYLQRTYSNNVMLLTATPFSNSPLEIYSMLGHVAHKDLVDAGIQNISTFFNLFVLPTTEWAANYKEQIIEKEVIKSFTNRLILNRLIYNHILYKTGEDAGVKRPNKINIPLLYKTDENGKTTRLSENDQVLTYLNMTDSQREQQNIITGMAHAATMGKLSSGLLFKALNFSLDNALSPFLRGGAPEDYKDFVTKSPKIRYALESIRTVKQWHEKRNEECSGQVIYMNRGKDFFPMVKEYLEKDVGFKRNVKFGKVVLDEVEIITSGISETKKENIKEAFLDNVVKVIIGTSTIREGIDLQRNGTAIYNLYPDWNPTDIRQLEGRIWRQGNKYKNVRVVMPLVSDSMDVFIFQKLEEKTARINDIWAKGNRKNVLDVESLDPQEIKMALITDVSRIVSMFFEQEVEEINREIKKVKVGMQTISEITWSIHQYKEARQRVHGFLKEMEEKLRISPYFEDGAEERGYPKNKINQAKELLKSLEAFNKGSEQTDKEALSLCRRTENLNISYTPYYVNRFKEYLSTVRKAERNILIPRGYTIDSDLDKVRDDIQKELVDLYRKAAQYCPKGTFDEDSVDSDYTRYFNSRTIIHFSKEQMKNSPRWDDLLIEVSRKKSTLNVTGKKVMERVKEFEKLNYLLGEKVDFQDKKPIIKIEQQKEIEERLDTSSKAEKVKAAARLKLKMKMLKLKLNLVETY